MFSLRSGLFLVLGGTNTVHMKKRQVLGFGYTPAQLRIGKETYIEWYGQDPVTGEFKRRKKKINFIIDEKERLAYGEKLVKAINENLARGVNPFIDDVGAKGVLWFRDAIAKFLEAKERELRANSIRSYKSYCLTLTEYVEKHREGMQCCHVGVEFVEEFMEFISKGKQVSARTFNNYRGFLKLMFNWMMDKQFIRENPAMKLRPKKETEKTRIIIMNERDRIDIKKYFRETDFNMYIAVMLVYHNLLRPGEVVELKPIHFDMKNQTIRIDPDNAKNGKRRFSTIPDLLMKDLEEWNFNGARSNQYIFGKDMVPGKEPLNPKRLAKKWSKMRLRLDLPKEYQLYSLRDTGIVDLLRQNTPVNDVMLQAGHSSLDMTTVYIKHFLPQGIENIKNKKQDF